MSEKKTSPSPQGKAGRKPAKALFEDGTYDLVEFHDVFVEEEDITEYKAAIILIGSWPEWERIKRDWPTFNQHLELWKQEITIRLKSKAIAKVNEIAQGDSPQATSAAKWIAEEGWNKRAGKGRPSKAERTREARVLAKAASDTEDESQRIFEVLEGGSKSKGIH